MKLNLVSLADGKTVKNAKYLSPEVNRN